MTVVTGNGISNLGVWGVLSIAFTVTSYSDTGFTATNANGTVTATGTSLTYSSSTGQGGPALVAVTGGTITGVSYSSGSSQQTWSGLSVLGADASNAIASGVMTNFNNLFFSGDDTFNFVSGTNTGIFGYDGNDTFNISNWNGGTTVDGGNGTDILNVTGGVSYSGFTPNFGVSNIETVRLFNGTYQLFPYVGFGGTVDGSALGTALLWGGGNNGNVTVIGGSGNDTFRPGSGVNNFNGGGGTNTLDLTSSGTGGSPNTVDLSITGSQQLNSSGSATLILSNIQNIVGRAMSDILTGDGGNNVIDGRGGTDTINGGGGNDTIIIGSQNGFTGDSATVDGGSGTDTVAFKGPLSRYAINLSGGTITFTDFSGVNSLTNVEYAQFTDQTVPLSGLTIPNISIGNASVTEGGVLHFGVTLDQATSLNITLGYDTFAGTASMANNDYIGGTGTLTILAGQTTGTINVQTVQDINVEPDETMSVHLLTTSFGAITQAVGTGTIVNVIPPNISIGNAGVTEGGVLHFGVTLDAATAQNITLGYDTFAGTASMANNDYLGGPGTLTILAGQTSGTINVQTVQDSTVEPDETMSVHLLTVSFGNITQGVGTGTIVNGVVPNISIGNASVTEGGVLHFGVTLDAAAAQNITLGYDTFAGTASMADNDYLGGPAALTILAGQTTGTINLQTVQDSKFEPDETMSVHLLTASFGNITQGVGTGTIVNDDAAPVVPNITIGNASVTEGGVLQFGVTLSAAAAQNITLGYDTFAGTAGMANNDYLGGPAALTILAGQTTGTINIQTVQDSTVEPDETMSVHLLTASFGNITQGVGTGTIVNDDAAPVVPNVTIGNASVTEGGVLQFGVTLDQATSQNITLSYDTFAGTASMANNDYLGGPAALTILAGQTTGTINIQTVQDSTVEPNETMSVHLLTASFGNISQGVGTGTIVNGVGPAVPNISIGNDIVTEGGVLHFGVTLDVAASQNITLSYDTFAGTASMADNDYLGGPGTLTILAGQTTGTINVQTVQDSKIEPDEIMSVHLLTASFGNITAAIGGGAIDNDDGLIPSVSIGNASVTEGGVLQFGLTLSAATSQNITLGYDTFAGTASMADNDYLGGPGTVTILAGQTTGTINIQTVQDSKFEPDETMSVHLMSISFGTIAGAIGNGTIANDDVAPVVPNISIGNASASEGGVLHFGVTLDQAASQNITLGYDTFAGTASMANNDYLGGLGTLTILAGQTTGTINIQTLQDGQVEPDETMSLHLLTASFGNIAQGIGTGTILSNTSMTPPFGTYLNSLATTLAAIS